MTDITSLHEIGLSEEGLINAALPLRDHVVTDQRVCLVSSTQFRVVP